MLLEKRLLNSLSVPLFGPAISAADAAVLADAAHGCPVIALVLSAAFPAAVLLQLQRIRVKIGSGPKGLIGAEGPLMTKHDQKAAEHRFYIETGDCFVVTIASRSPRGFDRM